MIFTTLSYVLCPVRVPCAVCCVCFLIGLIGTGNSLTGAYGLVGLNLLLPLAVTVLRGMIASLNPLSKYSVLKG